MLPPLNQEMVYTLLKDLLVSNISPDNATQDSSDIVGDLEERLVVVTFTHQVVLKHQTFFELWQGRLERKASLVKEKGY